MFGNITNKNNLFAYLIIKEVATDSAHHLKIYMHFIFSFSKELQLQKRWRNLRDNFARELNKKRYNSNHKRKSTYVYFDSLFFLSNVIKCRNESSQNTGDTSMDSEFQENAETNRNSCKLVFLQGRDDELKQEIEEADEDSNFQSTSQGWNSYVEESLEHSESKLRRIERSKSDDDDELFLLSLLGPLKKIPEHRRLYTRVEILKVIIDAQEKAGVEDPLK